MKDEKYTLKPLGHIPESGNKGRSITYSKAVAEFVASGELSSVFSLEGAKTGPTPTGLRSAARKAGISNTVKVVSSKEHGLVLVNLKQARKNRKGDR